MKYYINQLSDKDCAMTSLKILLSILYKNKDFLYYPYANIDESLSLKNIMAIAKKEGVTLGGYRCVDYDGSCLNKVTNNAKNPFLIPIKEDDTLHMIVVKKVKEKKIFVYDPKRGCYWIKNENLKVIWNGEFLKVEKIKGSDFKLTKTRIIPTKYTFITILFEILSFGSFIGALYFVSDSLPFYISLIMFGFYVIFEFFYRKSLINTIKYFDRSTMLNVDVFNHKDFKERYANMTRFKVISISNPAQILSIIVMTIFGIVVLLLNSPYNAFSVVAIILFEFLFKIFEKYFIEGKRNYINSIEKDINISKTLSNETFIKKIQSLNIETYNYVSYSTFKRYVMYFLMIALSLMFAIITNSLSINFVLFHFFFYLYLGENMEQVFNFSRNYDEYKYYKCLFLYYFNKY